MGEKQSNPVLEVLNNNPQIKQEVKYPEGFLRFNQAGWRAFYHCHANQKDIKHLFKNEHGHFHIFAPASPQSDNWSHLVALSMDEFGQPIRWFMVNHWVSGETWLEADLLARQLQTIPFAEQTSILEQWLMSMLVVYQSEIFGLLNERDHVIKSKEDEDCKQDRSLYLLAEQEIKLQQKLEQLT